MKNPSYTSGDQLQATQIAYNTVCVLTLRLPFGVCFCGVCIYVFACLGVCVSVCVCLCASVFVSLSVCLCVCV